MQAIDVSARVIRVRAVHLPLERGRRNMKGFFSDSGSSRMTGTTGMRRRLTRRTTYIVTMVAILAVAGGFAVASLTLGSNTVASTQGSTESTLSATAWSAQSITNGLNGGSCVASGGAGTTITSTTTVTAIVPGTSSACASGDISETIVYTATVPAGTSGTTLTDTFKLYSDACSGSGCIAASTTYSITETVTESGTQYTATFDFVVDYGTTTGPVTISGLSVAINGAF